MKVLPHRAPSTSADAWHFPRPKDVDAVLKSLKSEIGRRLYFFAPRRRGKTQFLLLDLAPGATKAGFTVIYASMWGDPDSPQSELLMALRTAGEAQQKRKSPTAAVLREALKTIGAKAAFAGAELSAEIQISSDPVSATSKELQEIHQHFEALTERRPLLLLLDEIQHLGTKPEFESFAASIRTRIDQNTRLHLVCTGSSRSHMEALTGSDRAFHRFATEYTFGPLGPEFAEHIGRRYTFVTGKALDPQKLEETFERVDRSPFYLRAIIEAMVLNPDLSVPEAHDRVMEGVALAGQYESKWSRLRPLDQLVLARAADGQPLFSQDAAAWFQARLGEDTPVSRGRLQSALRRLTEQQYISPRPGERGTFELELPGLRTWIQRTLE